MDAVGATETASVLDLACGPGNAAAFLRQARPEWTMLCADLAPAMLKEAAARLPGIRTLQLDACEVGSLAERFDAAAFCFGLSYLDDAGAHRCLDGLRQVLRPGAPLLLLTLTGDPAQSGPRLPARAMWCTWPIAAPARWSSGWPGTALRSCTAR